MSGNTRLLIAGDQALVREGMIHLLDRYPAVEIVARAMDFPLGVIHGQRIFDERKRVIHQGLVFRQNDICQ
jgi:hypothetical protein